MRNLSKGVEVGGVTQPHWSDDESELPPAKRARDNGYASDHTAVTDYDEMWTQHIPDTRNVILTPPSMETHSVDVRGPCGMTPLMVAAVKGGGLDTGEEDEEDGTAAVIADLVAQGADLNATMDKTGETALHLAARYARADASKRLLDAGAEANSQDNTGRTPLHAAVAADAMGAFQILLRNRATNLNARMHDGTTPLILAARLAIEGMVEDLINADADINAADNSGKTALHWAAAVNNVDAVNILLSHGANRDAQDDKDETPLFLAAKEGSFEACKVLLDNFSNREITDHMDRLPRDVASERLHTDIVRLLDEHVPRSPQVLSVVPNGQLIGSPSHPHLLGHPAVMGGPAPVGTAGKGSKGKKRGKADSGNSPENEAVTMRRKPSVKKKKEELVSGGGPDNGNGVYSSPGLPPPYDECLKGAVSMQSLHSLSLEPAYAYQTVGSAFQEPSPPHSVTMSPGKTRPQLPTSPTHMAAMRQAAQQKHAVHAAMQFDFSELPYTMGMYQQPQQSTQQPQQSSQPPPQQYYHYLTPPSDSIHAPESFPTPSPESPWHWSSSSPHSNSDWSEGISSPNNTKQQDAIYI
uniref:Neurogenic locus Notch protein n=1 Tax=Lygus hesperus TaxID=30085 RepID=A0A0A9W2B0_LYGHE